MHDPSPVRLLGVMALASLGCGARSELDVDPPCEREGVTRPCATICGTGVETCEEGRWRTCSAPRPGDRITLFGTVRDFSQAHPDFEGLIADDRGIVESRLGADAKPVYAGDPTTPTTSGKARFDEWYRDVPGVNLARELGIALRRDDGVSYRLDAPSFFPIDGELLGNEGHAHNFHFTFELHTSFRYLGGETFRFSGDDDVWVFVNERLAIDLGGVHGEQSAQVDLDDAAGSLAIEPGGTYRLDLFFAERHLSSSTFRIDTSITELDACP